MNAPQHPYTKKLLAAVPRESGRLANNTARAIWGAGNLLCRPDGKQRLALHWQIAIGLCWASSLVY